ncbi:hypothetical protein OJAV_G00129140 [Oryzias javanicus]|uniref:Major facilitator superfamily (MFS) profile domain-containing protein n=1 Tax=Oryzias javanicus TaxID=123683 RepID=A0A3S2U7S9_ORYJA|nr:hypothetical protein OJAV_G00129140 [Oryzias javanicus]
MYEPDTAAILPEDFLSAASTDDPSAHSEEEEDRPQITKAARPPSRCPLPVSVEPVLFLSMFSLVLQTPLATQYLWDRISEELGYNGSRRSECNSSEPADPLQKEVETLTAHWNLYINLGGFSVGLLVVPLLGSWSDLAAAEPSLSSPTLVWPCKQPGLSGDFNAILAGSFAYVADISDRRSRTFRVAVLEACLGLAGILASIIGGEWRRAQGYINPFWLVLATNLASALYASLVVRESVLPDPTAKLLTTRHHKAVWRLYSSGGSSTEGDRSFRRCKLWLYSLCFFLLVTVHSGSRELYVLYELSPPLCWGSALIGYGSAAQNLAYLTSLLGLRIMQLCMEDSWVALVSLASNIIGLLVFAVADSTQLMFTGYGLCFLFMAVTPVLRSKLSKLVDPLSKTLCFLVGSGIFNSLYPATLHFMKGFTFLFAAILLLIPAGIIGTLQCLDQRRGLRESAVS